jgi:hypothetical protein
MGRSVRGPSESWEPVHVAMRLEHRDLRLADKLYTSMWRFRLSVSCRHFPKIRYFGRSALTGSRFGAVYNNISQIS